MPLISFPNVPDYPGVPDIPRSPSGLTIPSFVSDIVQQSIWRILQIEHKWGIFDANGNALGNPSSFKGVTSDILQTFGIGPTLSINGIDFSRETRISDFPIEKGSFASFNKVQLPVNVSVTMCFCGSDSDRSFFLDQLEIACASINLYNVVTPEITYLNFSIDRYSYQRFSNKGAYLLIFNVNLREIRQVTPQYTQSQSSQINNPKNSASTQTQNNGQVQAQNLSPVQSKVVVNKTNGKLPL